jgi:hypothetical protein
MARRAAIHRTGPSAPQDVMAVPRSALTGRACLLASSRSVAVGSVTSHVPGRSSTTPFPPRATAASARRGSLTPLVPSRVADAGDPGRKTSSHSRIGVVTRLGEATTHDPLQQFHHSSSHGVTLIVKPVITPGQQLTMSLCAQNAGGIDRELVVVRVSRCRQRVGGNRAQVNEVMAMVAGPLVPVTPCGVRHCAGVVLRRAAVMTTVAPVNRPAVTVPW